MKKLCKTQKNIIERIRNRQEDPVVSNKALFCLHCTMYHRVTSEYGRQMEHCRIWNEIADEVSWEEMVVIANSSEPL